MKAVNNIATNELHICSQESGTIWGLSGTLLCLVADRFKRNFLAFRIDQSQGRRRAVCRVVQSVRSCLREWRNGWVSDAFGSSATICHCCLASKCTVLDYQTFFRTESNCFGGYQTYWIVSTVHSFGQLVRT
jgi:hypothetical protein